jgi:hypothetical protein
LFPKIFNFQEWIFVCNWINKHKRLCLQKLHCLERVVLVKRLSCTDLCSEHFRRHTWKQLRTYIGIMLIRPVVWLWLFDDGMIFWC